MRTLTGRWAGGQAGVYSHAHTHLLLKMMFYFFLLCPVCLRPYASPHLCFCCCWSHTVCPASYSGNNASAITCSSNLEWGNCTAPCISGYSGTLSMTCGSNGAWAVTAGTCIKSECVDSARLPPALNPSVACMIDWLVFNPTSEKFRIAVSANWLHLKLLLKQCIAQVLLFRATVAAATARCRHRRVSQWRLRRHARGSVHAINSYLIQYRLCYALILA